MIKVLAFMESDLPRVEEEVNKYADKYTVAYIHSTGSRLVFILKDKPRSHRPNKKSEEETEES